MKGKEKESDGKGGHGYHSNSTPNLIKEEIEIGARKGREPPSEGQEGVED